MNHKNGIKNDNRVENLEWVNQKENTIHARLTGLIDTAKKDFKKGEQNPRAILTEKQVLEIIRLNGLAQSEIASRYGISRQTVADIWNGRRWSHLKRNNLLEPVKEERKQ